MSETPGYNAQDLVRLSKVDISIGRIIAETREVERSVEEREKKVATLLSKLKNRREITDNLKKGYDREEKDLKFQQDKLSTRRKTLSSLGNAKAQIAAEREIDATSKQLLQREDKLLAVLSEIEAHENEVKRLEEELNSAQKDLEELQAGLADRFNSLSERRTEKEAERRDIVLSIPGDFVRRYETVVRKYSLDPVVPITRNTCGGCSIQLVPQVLVKVAKASSPVQCPGCSRILYLEQNSEEADNSPV